MDAITEAGQIACGQLGLAADSDAVEHLRACWHACDVARDKLAEREEVSS